jgi:hemoglobin
MNFRFAAPLLALALLLGQSGLVVPQMYGAPATDFKALMRKVLDAWETLDPAKAAPFYAQDAGLAFYDIAPLKYTGWAEYAEGVKKAFPDIASLKFTMGADAQVHQRGNLAWTTATLRLDMVSKGGSRESLDTRWTVVWEKRGKNWLIVHEHYSAPLPSLAERAGQPLYKRVGGYDAIAAVVDDFLGRLLSDRQLQRFFAGTSADSQRRIRQLVVDQICGATGGPCFYLGRSMIAAHEGLNITEADWQAAVKHLVATLDKFKVPEKEKGELLAAVASMRADIVASGGTR